MYRELRSPSNHYPSTCQAVRLNIAAGIIFDAQQHVASWIGALLQSLLYRLDLFTRVVANIVRGKPPACVHRVVTGTTYASLKRPPMLICDSFSWLLDERMETMLRAQQNRRENITARIHEQGDSGWCLINTDTSPTCYAMRNDVRVAVVSQIINGNNSGTVSQRGAT